jgi:hypothetical protein
VPSTSSRSRVTRRSPRAAGRTSAPQGRPPVVPFAVVFGLLLAVEVLYLGYLLWEPAPAFDWYLVVPVVLAVLAVIGSVLVLRGRARGWIVLAVAAVLPLAALLAFAFVLGALGAVAEMWAAVLLTAGPIGCLVLATRRPVRQWTTPPTATRSAGGRRDRRADH